MEWTSGHGSAGPKHRTLASGMPLRTTQVRTASSCPLRRCSSAAVAKLHQQHSQQDQARLERDMKQNETLQDLKAQHGVLRARQAARRRQPSCC